jgi:hypothetical protein
VDGRPGCARTPHRHGADNVLRIAVTGGTDAGQWAYYWPGERAPQIFFASRLYELLGPNGTAHVRVARCRRPAWGRERERAVVFKHQGGPDSRTYYQWTEFVETDDGRFAAVIPNPQRPRTLLREGGVLPDHLQPAHVARSDQLFGSIRSGASLRYVVDRAHEVSMIEHGYWVAALRHRI